MGLLHLKSLKQSIWKLHFKLIYLVWHQSDTKIPQTERVPACTLAYLLQKIVWVWIQWSSSSSDVQSYTSTVMRRAEVKGNSWLKFLYGATDSWRFTRWEGKRVSLWVSGILQIRYTVRLPLLFIALNTLKRGSNSPGRREDKEQQHSQEQLLAPVVS